MLKRIAVALTQSSGGSTTTFAYLNHCVDCIVIYPLRKRFKERLCGGSGAAFAGLDHRRYDVCVDSLEKWFKWGEFMFD